MTLAAAESSWKVAGHEFGRVGESKTSAPFLQGPERVKKNGFWGV